MSKQNQRQAHVAVGEGLMCSECGLPRTAPIHTAAPPQGPSAEEKAAAFATKYEANAIIAAAATCATCAALATETTIPQREVREVNPHVAIGTMEDFLHGFCETAPDGAAACEFGRKANPGVYVSYHENGADAGRFIYFHEINPRALRSLGEREGAWLASIRNARPLPFARPGSNVVVA